MRKTTLIIAALLCATPAVAQEFNSCQDAVEMAKHLASKYDEAPTAFGLQSNGNLLEVYWSAAHDTWTEVSTTPNGVSCIVAAGKRWESTNTVCSAVSPEGKIVYFRCGDGPAS